jgi:hypothetical protein
MKTQISTLQNGCIEGIACGSNSEERSAIAAKVFAENPESITVTCNGITKTLKKYSSKSGLTSWYESEVTEEEVNILEGVRIDCRRFEFESSFSLFLLGDCRICIEKSTRKSPAAEWKFRGYDYLSESTFKIEG